ncbi:serine hydrolase [Pseudoalteromonas sp. Of7M-16]|uniref:serine hydrolase n=1 Tax=Pseudoalteromonas sp. Of7M-16 TaxID=2917756 RepID=UPI001EF727C5|nr:serine hydrolase [Pseudoalteromonas sp. Of7M-16]MCG7551736.1 serine hydrolase [Pseudoalteromonas sp. Of7M-16]
MKKRYKSSILSVAIVIALTGCSDEDTIFPVTDDSKLSGVYERTGYGQLIHFKENDVTQYQFNTIGCKQQLNMPRAQFFDSADDLKRSFTGNHYSYIDPSLSRLTRVELAEIANLPASCNLPQWQNSQSPLDNFEYFWHSINDHYGFLQHRGIDWMQRYLHYRPQINADTPPERLFDIMRDMVSGFNDAQVSLQSSNNVFNAAQPGIFQQLANNLTAEFSTSFEQNMENLLQGQNQLFLAYIQPSTLQQAGNNATPPALQWGVNKDNIGFIKLNRFAGFSDTQDTASEIRAAEQAFREMMSSLRGTQAIIIDNRLNSGSIDDIAISLANFFANDNIEVYSKKAVNVNSDRNQQVSLTPERAVYTNPVRVINGKSTAGSAEVFALSMAALDHVALIGSVTQGALSNPLAFTLPNGWQLNISNESYLDSQKKLLEVAGIQPDQQAHETSRVMFAVERQPSYDLALKQLGMPAVRQMSLKELEHIASRAADSGIYPGISMAIIKNGKLVMQKGFGTSGLAGDRSKVTPDTPFYLGSLSKGFLGTTVALNQAQYQISLDTSLDEALSFAVELPKNYHAQPNLKHLLTYTSGVLDSDIYRCNIYFVASGTSFWNRVENQSNCPNDVIIDSNDYLQAYLNPGGLYYRPDNYTDEPAFTQQLAPVYSNVATALLASAIENLTGERIQTLSDQSIFAPLEMYDTSWEEADFNGRNPIAIRFGFHDGQYQALPDYAYSTRYDGMLKSSMADLTKFAMELLKQDTLEPSVLNTAMSPLNNAPHAGGSEGVGYFWFLDHDHIHLNGGDPGVFSYLAIDKTSKSAVILASNGDETHPEFKSQIQILGKAAWDYIYTQE